MPKKKNYRRTATSPPSARSWWLWIGVAAAIVLVGGAAFWLTSNSRQPKTGTPDLVVDQLVLDEGYQKLDTVVRTSFTLRNEGDAPLRILGEPQVELVEGC